jgi:dTMP kinase
MGLKKGFLVVFEGIDGAGKTTQANLLFEDLKRRGFDVVLSKEPTDSIYGRKIKKLANAERDLTRPLEEYQLFVNDRKIHVENVIKPALARKQIVILDRYYLSTIAYQGALGLDPNKIRTENEAFAPIPEIVFLLKVPPRVGIRRIQKIRNEDLNLFEGEENLTIVESIFESITESYIVAIEGVDDIEVIHGKIMNVINSVLAHYQKKEEQYSLFNQEPSSLGL